MKEPREVDGAVHAIDLAGRETEIRLQAVDDFLVGTRLNFQAHRRTLPAAVKLHVHRFQDAAGLLFLEIEVAVARDAKGGGGKYFVAVVKPLGECVNDVMQKDILDAVLGRREAHQAGQSARHGDDSQINLRAAPLALEQKGEAERLVQDMGKRVGGIHGHGREKRFDRLRVEIFDVLASFGAQIAASENANRFGVERGNEIVAPAFVLLVHEIVDFRGEVGKRLLRNAAVSTRLAISVLHLLHQAGEAHFDEFVQVARGDAQKLYALEQRIAGIARLFEDPLVELHPGQVTIEESLGVGNGGASHACL